MSMHNWPVRLDPHERNNAMLLRQVDGCELSRLNSADRDKKFSLPVLVTVLSFPLGRIQ